MIPVFTALVLTAGSCLSEALFLDLRSRDRHGAALFYKGLAALLFCCLGLVFAKGDYRILLGLLLGLLGDVLLGLRKLWPKHHDLTFISGALAFSLGHGIYIWYLLDLSSASTLWATPLLILLVVLSEVFAHKAGFHRGRMHLPGLLYIAIEAAMCAMALVRFAELPGMATAFFALGGLSFLVSDNLLCAYSFGSMKTKAADRALHATYLAAQLLIAWSRCFL